MLHRHCVPRELYDRLFDAYEKLRLAGAAAPPEPRPAKVTTPGPTPEERAERRMHDQLVESLAKEIEKLPGVDPTLAKAEADRIRREALGDGTPT